MKMFLRSALALLLVAATSAGVSQAASLPSRLRRDAASSAPMALPQGVSPRVKGSTVLGHLDGRTRVAAMALVLSPTAEQSAALDQLLADQQNPKSPRYHQWLTPAQFGAAFGVSDSDLKVLQDWLTSQGFQINEVAPSRNRITFSGDAATVEAAFHTEMSRFSRGGQQFFENSTAPELPSALQGVVRAVTGLSSWRMQPMLKRAPVAVGGAVSASTLGAQRPNYNSATSSNHYLSPWDFRQIYNANGLFNSGNTGAGVTIAVLGQSSVDLNQIANFQQLTGQTQKAPTLVLVPGTGASQAYQGDELESESDLEYAGGVAPGANLLFVYVGNSTTFNNGNGASVADALNYAITNNVAQVLTYSYGGCETENSITALVGQEGYFREANAQGQTILVASGDTGAAGCEYSTTTAYDGQQVGYPASSPYVTGIGGTSFNDMGNPSLYWYGSNNGQAGSAVGYIPESAWNENSSDPLAAGGGGPSHVFGKPSWQVGSGVPNDGARDVPDISFSAAEHDAYLVCSSDSSYTSTSSGVTVTAACTTTAFGIGRVGGTSLPTPAFAGALAMMMQANNKTAGLGNINPLLYGLLQTSAAVFHDVTTGSNIDPCAAGTVGCVNGSLGFNAGPGYDLATGLGSLDLGGFSGNLTSAVGANSRAVTLAITVTEANTSAIAAEIRAIGVTNTAVPTGSVSVSLDGGTPQPAALSGSSSTVAAAALLYDGPYSPGTHALTVTYAGDANFSAASASATFNISTTNGGLTVTASPSTVTINSSTAHSGSWSLSTTSTNSYTGIVGFSIAPATGSTMPKTGCFFGQGDLGISPNGTVATTVTYSYSNADCTGANVIVSFGNTRKQVSQHGDAPRQRELPLLAIGFTGLLGSAMLRRRKLWMTGLLGVVAMAGTAGLSGCGSGSTPLDGGTTGGTGGTGGSGTTSPAPKGTYNMVITASDYVNQSPTATTNVTLVIQ